jgi:hypothetical protein
MAGKKKKTRKKRGRPIGSRNKRVNQYVYIRSLIWKERGSKYKSFFDPELISMAKRLNDECKTLGTDCDAGLILHFHDEWIEGGNRYPLPNISPILLEIRPYWEIKDITDFASAQANIMFYSPMLIAPPSEFRSVDYGSYRTSEGGRDYSIYRGYSEYFKEWVDWCNEQYRNAGVTDSEEIEIYFKIIPPTEFDEQRGFWIVEIVSCTSDGRISSFGFTPTGSGGEGEFTSPEEETTIIQHPQSVQEQVQQTETLQEKIQAEEYRKDKELERLLKMKEDAKDDYKFWKDMDDRDEMEESKKRIKEITTLIDNLRNGS